MTATSKSEARTHDERAAQTTNEAATDFVRRHIGPSPRDVAAMLETVGAKSLGALMAETLPSSIRQKAPLDLGARLERNRSAGAYGANSPRRTRCSPR